jgi:hypothetical protein
MPQLLQVGHELPLAAKLVGSQQKPLMHLPDLH